MIVHMQNDSGRVDVTRGNWVGHTRETYSRSHNIQLLALISFFGIIRSDLAKLVPSHLVYMPIIS